MSVTLIMILPACFGFIISRALKCGDVSIIVAAIVGSVADIIYVMTKR